MRQGLLRGREFEGLKFIRRKPIGRFVVNFYCAELMLAVEIDGDSHEVKKEYNKMRTEKLKDLGITVVRYSNKDILENPSGVEVDLKQKIERLRRELKDRPPIAPPAARDRLLAGGQNNVCPPEKGDYRGFVKKTE